MRRKSVSIPFFLYSFSILFQLAGFGSRFSKDHFSKPVSQRFCNTMEAELALEVENINREFKRAEQRRSYALTSLRYRISLGVKLVAVFIFVKTANEDSTLSYLNHRQRTAFQSGEVDPHVIDDVLGWMPTAEIDRTYHHAQNDDNHHIAVTAWKHIAEHATYKWLLEQNIKGLAVPTRTMINHYVQNIMPSHVGPIMKKHLDSLKKTKKKSEWARLFRKRWGISYKKLRPRPHKPKSVRTAQASSLRNRFF